MNAHAGVMPFPRAPLDHRRTPSRSAPSRRQPAIALSEARNGRRLRELAPGSASLNWSWRELSRFFPPVPQSLVSLRIAVMQIWKAGDAVLPRVPVSFKLAIRLAAGTLTGAMIVLAIVNNARSRAVAVGFSAAPNETVVFRHLPTQKFSIEDAGEPAMEPEEAIPPTYPRMVQTIKFVDPNSSEPARFAATPGPAMPKVGGFIAFAGTQAADQAVIDGTEWPAAGRRNDAANMDVVDRYLWEVYQRAPTKRDHSGDFTWKDLAAAKRMGISLPGYVIGGMDPDFREQLYHAGQAMDAAGIRW